MLDKLAVPDRERKDEGKANHIMSGIRTTSRQVRRTNSIQRLLLHNYTHVSSSGILELFDRKSALIYLDFKEAIPFRKRQVLGMHHDDGNTTAIASRITIRRQISTLSLPNQGSFGRKFSCINTIFLTNCSNFTDISISFCLYF